MDMAYKLLTDDWIDDYFDNYFSDLYGKYVYYYVENGLEDEIIQFEKFCKMVINVQMNRN